MFKRTIYSYLKKSSAELKAFIEANPQQLGKQSFNYYIPLYKAICIGKFDAIDTLVEMDIKLSTAEACQHRLQHATTFALKRCTFDKFDPYVPALEKLMNYSRAFDINAVYEFVLSNGNRTYVENYTPLIWATRHDNVGACRILVEQGGADIFAQMPDGTNAIDHAKSPELKAFYRELQEKMRNQSVLEGFRIEQPHLVSHVEHAPNCDEVLKTLFNFKYQTITYVDNSHEDRSLFVESFTKAASPRKLNDAAKFRQANGGDTHGFKPQLIQ